MYSDIKFRISGTFIIAILLVKQLSCGYTFSFENTTGRTKTVQSQIWSDRFRKVSSVGARTIGRNLMKWNCHNETKQAYCFPIYNKCIVQQ